MSSLALTDALLVVSGAFLLRRASVNVGVRLATAVLMSAAVLGVLRFSGWWPLPGPHQFMVNLSSAAGLPLLTVALLQSESAIAKTRQAAWVFFMALAGVGLVVSTALGIKLYAQAMAVLSVLALIVGMARQRNWQASAAGVCMLVGMVLFVGKLSMPGVLVPGDFLHLGLAAGLGLLMPKRTMVAPGTRVGDLSVRH